jgi:tetratricopeptide (TPR) repeat protein
MLENLSGKDFKSQLKENKALRLVTYFVGAIVVLVIGYFAYRTFIWTPNNDKSKDAYWVGLNYAAVDSTDAAIDELTRAKKQYDGKQGGELAQFVLARQLMAKGNFKKALEELDGVKLTDTYLSIYKLGLQGDCKSELKQYKEAKDMYIKASVKNKNDKTTPEFLFKAGLVSEKLNDNSAASDLYTQIKNEYPTFANQKAIDKYIARTKNKSNK